MRKLSAVLVCAALVSAASAVETPTMGWSSWNAFRVNISDKIIMDHADLVVQLGLDKLGYVYINTDDGYFGGRDADGRLKTHPTRFPNGLKAMVEHIHGLGLKAGIYSDAGENTCGSYWDKDEHGIGVGLWQHDQQDADYFFKELGFDFIKIDFCGGQAYCNSMKTNMDERVRYTAIRQAVDRAKPGVRINVCRWDYPGTWVGTIGSSWRISHDINPTWGNMKDIISQSLYLSAYAGPGSFNDMDMLEVGRGFSVEEDKTHFGVWCMMTSPLLIGCDLRKLQREHPEALELLKNPELIALDQDPLCQQAFVVQRDGERYVLVKDLEAANGPTRAVALVNLSDEESEISVDFATLDLAGEVQVRDLFARQDLASRTGKLAVTVPRHGTRIYRLTAAQRLERRLYEAETAWLSTYQELHDYKKAKTATYLQLPEASGGVAAVNVGGVPGNYLEWRTVHLAEAGERRVVVATRGAGAEAVRMSVNGVEVVLGAAQTLPDGATGREARVMLPAGDSVIRLFNDETTLPAIDYLTVAK